MYLIIVYDVKEKRVTKVLKYLRKYLNWIQNSVFEGEITEGGLRELQAGIKKMIKDEEDSIIFFKLPAEQNMEREVIGIEKRSIDIML